MECFVLLDIYL